MSRAWYRHVSESFCEIRGMQSSIRTIVLEIFMFSGCRQLDCSLARQYQLMTSQKFKLDAPRRSDVRTSSRAYEEGSYVLSINFQGSARVFQDYLTSTTRLLPNCAQRSWILTESCTLIHDFVAYPHGVRRSRTDTVDQSRSDDCRTACRLAQGLHQDRHTSHPS